MKGEHDIEDQTTQEPVVTPQPGPGSRLAKARAAANLSVEQVATSLNLTVGVVTALERDDPDQLPAAVFVRGYIKNYARLVGLRGDELVAQYEGSRTPEVPLELRPRPVSAAPGDGRGLSLRAVFTVLILVAAGSIAWWWLQGGRIDVPGMAGSAPSTQPTVPAPFAATPVPAQAPPVRGPVESTADTSRPAVDEAPPVAPTGTAAPLAEPVATPEPEPAPEPPPPEPTGHTLSLALSDDVWVEVVDDDGSRLVFDMLRSGTRREVSGEGPFLVLLGKAGAVQVELDGRSVDHAPFENKGIARFVLDDQEGEIVTRAP